MSPSRRAIHKIAQLPLGAHDSISQGSACICRDTCPFRLSVINDEMTPDFGRACEIATKDFGLHWIELRSHVEQERHRSRRERDRRVTQRCWKNTSSA